MEAITLNQENLKAISHHIPCPNYDRSKIKTGIVHVGVGGSIERIKLFTLMNYLKKRIMIGVFVAWHYYLPMIKSTMF